MVQKRSQARVWGLILICCLLGGAGPVRAEMIKEAKYDLTGLPKGLANKINNQRRELIKFKIALLAYAAQHNQLPKKIADVIGPETGLELPPRDLFRQQMTITYIVQSNLKEAKFYSYGPDGDDDQGTDIATPAEKGKTPQGDIVDSISFAEYEKIRAEDKKFTEKMHRKLVEIRQKTGRDNAMIHYVEACWLMDMPDIHTIWDDYETEIMKSMSQGGWNTTINPAAGVIARFEPALAEARKGIALDYAVNDLCLENPDQVLPFLKMQTLARLFAMDGQRLEFIGKPAEAMDEYLGAITMGRDVGTAETSLIGGLIGISVQQIALNRIVALTKAVPPDTKILERTAARLKQIEATQPRFADITASERKTLDAMVEVWRKGTTQQIREDAGGGIGGQMGVLFKTRISGEIIDAFTAGRKKADEFDKVRFSIPIWQREARGYSSADFERMKEKMQQWEKLFVINCGEPEQRYFVLGANLSVARCAVALEIYKRKHGGAYPNTLTALVPDLLEAVPLDPFSGKPLNYVSSGRSYRLWSVGPDLKSNAGMVTYDPTNGTNSIGDIFQER